MKYKDKQRIQQDIKNRADEHGGHAGQGEPLGINKIIQAGGHQGEEGSCRVDGQIGIGVGKSDGTGAKPHQQLILQEKKSGCQNQGETGKHEEGVGQNLPGFGNVFFSQPDAKEDRTADAHQSSERRKQGDNRSAHAHAGQGVRADCGNVTDVHPVDNAV